MRSNESPWTSLFAAFLLFTPINLRTVSAQQNNSGAYQWNLPRGFPKPYVPADNPMTGAKVELGSYLFYDTRMSVKGKESSASCHKQELAFTDGRAVGVGATGELHSRSAMSLVNVTYSGALTWSNPEMKSLEVQENFNHYDVLRINEMPVVEVHIVPSQAAPGGIGEASTPSIIPAAANAIFAATSKRLRKLPILPEDLA
jgi:hypothetical protein